MSNAVGQGAEGPAQVLLARDRADRGEKTAKLVDSLRDAILKDQEKDGFWKPGGQLPAQKRPLTETTQVSTIWCALALDSLDPPNEKAIEARDRALAWLRSNRPTATTRPSASSGRGCGLWPRRRSATRNRSTPPRPDPCAQNPDGGWGWLLADREERSARVFPLRPQPGGCHRLKSGRSCARLAVPDRDADRQRFLDRPRHEDRHEGQAPSLQQLGAAPGPCSASAIRFLTPAIRN